MRVLITGVTGFVGSHLADHLIQATDWEVIGISRTLNRLQNVEHLLPRLRLQIADCEEASSIEPAIRAIKPDAIFHLAGQALEPISWKEPAATFLHNVVSEINLFEAVLKAGLEPRILIAGSGLAYGLIKPEENPVNEDQPPRPASPYAVSKIAADYLGYQYFASYHLPVFRLRPFNQLGPRQQPEFAIPAFARQIARIEAGEIEPVLRVGNLEAVRDFTDVRDAVIAYRLVLEKGEPGEAYNLGTGTGYVMESLLDRLLSMSPSYIRVEPDPARMRPVDVPRIVADATKLRERTGWRPSIVMEQSLGDTLDYWRSLEGESH